MEFVAKRYAAERLPAGKPCKRGHVAERYAKFGGCVECVRENNARMLARRKPGENAARLRKWAAENREYSNARRLQHRVENPERIMVNAARRTAKARNLPFNLTFRDILIPDVCPVLGIPLTSGIGGKERTNNSASLDRIIPELGYVRGNVMVISWRANFIKSDASAEELSRVANFYGGLIGPSRT